MERNHNSDKTTRDKLVLLVGPSGSGKTTIAKELEKEGYNIIHSYTTRKPREENEWGHTFINNNTFNSMDKSDMIAYFNNYERDEHYFATEQQYQGKGTSIYVVDPSGAKEVQERVKDAEVITIFLMAEEMVRLRRMRNSRTTDEAHNRIYNDRSIFKICKCDYVVDVNRPPEEVLEIIRDIII